MVVINGADSHTAYSGSTDIKTGFSGLLEVRKVADFEGVVHCGPWGSPNRPASTPTC